MTANSPRAFGRQLRAARVTRLIAALLETGVGRYATPIVALSVAAVLTVLIVPFHLPRQIKSPYLTQPAYSITRAQILRPARYLTT